MIKPADSDEEKEEESDKAVAVKDDPQFTIAVTRGMLAVGKRLGIRDTHVGVKGNDKTCRL